MCCVLCDIVCVSQGLEEMCRGRRFKSPLMLDQETENGNGLPSSKRHRLASS